jgi:flavin-dependent dehydrogenase
MIRRVEFDDLLVRLAVEAGVDLVEGVEIAQASEAADGVSCARATGVCSARRSSSRPTASTASSRGVSA